MLKKIIIMVCGILMLGTAVFAADPEPEFSGTVKGENVEITVTATEGVNARTFVYTYTVSGAGHCIIHEVEKSDIPSGESKTLVITPPEEGYSKKLVVADMFTLKPLCKSNVYPYMVNVFAKPLGYTLKDVGTVTEGDKTYASNTFEINTGEFEYDYEEDPEPSVLSLQLSSLE